MYAFGVPWHACACWNSGSPGVDTVTICFSMGPHDKEKFTPVLVESVEVLGAPMRWEDEEEEEVLGEDRLEHQPCLEVERQLRAELLERRRREEEDEARRLRCLEEAEQRRRELAERRRRREAAEAEEARKREQLEALLGRQGFEGVGERKKRGLLGSGFVYPLHAAVFAGDVHAVSLLLWAGADRTLTDSANRTPLELAQKLDNNGSHKALMDALSA